MRLDDQRPSDNVQDGGSGGGGFNIGGGGLLAGGGIGTLILVVVAMLFGVDPRALVQGGDAAPAQPRQSSPSSPYSGQTSAAQSNDPRVLFVAKVLGSTDDVWQAYFRENLGRDYVKPTLVHFTGSVNSACGSADSAAGPFYCPSDQKVYIDLSFYDELQQRFHAPGDFAQAYVVAHEVGHHVQNLTGISDKVHDMEERARSRTEANAWSVKLELQADCFAGVWAHFAQSTKNQLEPGDIEEGLTAASAIGDDTLQKQARGRVVPDSFTHGSSAQRVSWFTRGFQQGNINACDTFNSTNP
jgi:predicted metalloprotease